MTLPKFTLELPDDDTREIKSRFAEVREGTLHICVSISQDPLVDKLAKELAEMYRLFNDYVDKTSARIQKNTPILLKEMNYASPAERRDQLQSPLPGGT